MIAVRARFLSTLVLTLGVPGLFVGTGPVSADTEIIDATEVIDTQEVDAQVIDVETTPAVADYGSGCVLYPDDKAATIDSLRFRCSAEQQDAIFRDAPLGAVPTGVKAGWVTRPPVMQAVAPPLWIGKTFYTGPDGVYLMNRLTGAGV